MALIIRNYRPRRNVNIASNWFRQRTACDRSDSWTRIWRRWGTPAGLAGLAPLFAFFGGHTFPAVAHFAAEARAIAAVAAHATEKDSAESQQANSLPEGDCFPAEQRRKQPIPEMHHGFAADPDKSRDCHNCERGDPDQVL